jgi:hypothetical protein
MLGGSITPRMRQPGFDRLIVLPQALNEQGKAKTTLLDEASTDLLKKYHIRGVLDPVPQSRESSALLQQRLSTPIVSRPGPDTSAPATRATSDTQAGGQSDTADAAHRVPA